MNLENKTIVLTGGTSGIGFELVKILAPKNTVLVVARPGPRLENLKQAFPDVDVYPADLQNPAAYEDLAEKIIRRNETINVLINNAAVQKTPTFIDEDFSYGNIQNEIQINFTAICALSYLFLPALLECGSDASIVNINSGLALAPKTNSAVYSATKAAMNVFSQSLSYQLENTNVSVMQAFLPLVDTPMTEGRGKGKMDPAAAASRIAQGIARNAEVINIGKVKVLRFLLIVAPWLAKKIMRGL